MKKWKLLGVIMAQCVLIGLVVVYASPYAPPVQPVTDIEEIWSIEDARVESSTPLVTALENNGMPLAYDAENNVFYCTIGVGHEEEWPEVHLTAPGAKGVRLQFVDDYSYDWCGEAVSEGYSYEIIAYTETEYDYCNIVFTGLPQVCLYTNGEEITTEDSNIRVTVAVYGEEVVDSTARVHLRGASTLLFKKKSYKIEFTRERNGSSQKITQEIPAFGTADEVALLACRHDETKMRDKLNWDMWAELAQDNESFGARRTGYVEVFLDTEYVGVYLMIEPVDVKDEIALAGHDHVTTDSVYRTAALNFSRDREYYRHPHRGNAGYELYYAPVSADTFDKRFDGLMPYIELTKIEDDEEFVRRSLEIIDVDSMLRHVLLMQGAAIADNFFNNMFIWSYHKPDGNVEYKFSLWDLDMSWGFERDEIGEEYERWLFFPVADRMLNLDAGGIRQKAYDMWQEMRQGIFSMEWLENRVDLYTRMIGGSGALMRDATKWGNYMTYPDGYELITFANIRWPIIDQAMEMLVTTDGPVDFLSQSHYEQKAGDILFDGGYTYE